jgi:cytidylate kinase
MATKSSIELFRKYFDRQVSFKKENLHNYGFIPEPFITVSRQTGAGGHVFAEKLQDYLNTYDTAAKKNWTLFEKDLIQEVIKEHNLSEMVAPFLTEKNMSELQAVLEQVYGLHPSTRSLIHKISSTILNIANLGNAIIVGRGANIITRNLSNGFHIRLIASLNKRIRNIQDYLHVDMPAAKKIILQGDREKKEYIKKSFSKNNDDPAYYSLVANMDYIDMDNLVAVVGESLIKRRYDL